MSNVKDAPALMSVEQILEKANLDWTVSKRKVHFDNGGEGLVPFEKKAVIMRDDNKEPLEVLGADYSILQNSRLAEIAMEVAGSRNLVVRNGGSLSNGRIVYLQLDFKKNVRIGKDSVGRFITLMNSHDGSSSFKIGFGNEVMSCKNQYHYFSRKSNMNFRHSSGLHESVEKVLKQLEFIREEESFLMANFKSFAEVDVTPKLVDEMIKRITGVDMTLSEERKSELYSTRKLNTVQEIVTCINNEMDSKGKTLWGLFNGVTYFTNHVQCANKASGSNYSLRFGTGYEMNREAYRYASSLVS